MFGIGAPELILILVIALVVFGPGKLPELGKSVGKALTEFKKASRDFTNEMKDDNVQELVKVKNRDIDL